MHHNGDPDLLTILDVARQLRVDDMTVRRWITQGVLEAMTLPHHGTRQSNRLCRAPLEALLFPGHMPNGGPTTGLTDVGLPSVLQRSSALEAEQRPGNGTSPAAYLRALGHLERYARDGLIVH